MPDSFVILQVPRPRNPKVSSSAPQGAAATPANAVPRFGAPPHLVPDNFWSNLKDFLTERPPKVGPARRGTPFTQTSFGTDFFSNLSDLFRSTPAPVRGARISRLEVNWGAGFGSFGQRLKEYFFPPKLPPLRVTSRPVRVRDIWSKDENFGWTQAISILLHGGLIALMFVPIFTHMSQTSRANTKPGVEVIDISPYISKLPAGAQKAGGGGGGGDRSPLPATKGRAPKFDWTQFTPPTAVIKNERPKLAMDPSLLGPPDLKVANPPLSNYGDPLASVVNLSNGPGGGSGIGTGLGGGIGSGSGGGLGPGSGGGTGGGVFRAGINGVGTPVCYYMPDPQYSDEARKAKFQGTVLLDVLITVDGRVINPRVIKGVGLGLEEKAIEAVREWRCKPATGPSGKPVPTLVNVEVTFRLF